MMVFIKNFQPFNLKKMKEFLLLFRSDLTNMPQRSPEEAQAATRRWIDWIQNLAAQNQLIDKGNRLSSSGKVVKANNVVINGPYTEIKESLGGYTLIKAASYEAAVDLVKDCPILLVGGTVEIREISPL
jgi:hypothetical protein